MKYFILILLFFICVANSYGQKASTCFGLIVVEIIKERNATKISVKTELMSASNLDSSLVQSIDHDIIQSTKVDKRVKTGTYIVAVKFILLKGSFSDIVCETDPGFNLCQAVLRVIKKSKTWTPATQ